ncbi:MAG: RNA polymerase sigma factor [Clostridia bacterium]|nr:RNA polymerase sigma factor [Clostridia bacterium]
MDELYAQHFEALARFCTVLCRDGEKGADLAQETFLRALEHAEQLMPLKSEQKRAWLFRTAKNLFMDEARRTTRFLKRQQMLYEGEGAEEPGFSQAEMSLLLLRLPPDVRAMFRMRYLDGYSAAELAEIFRMPAATVRTKLSRAKQLLQKEISR